jgi:hypothetical protein
VYFNVGAENSGLLTADHGLVNVPNLGLTSCEPIILDMISAQYLPLVLDILMPSRPIGIFTTELVAR